MKIWIIVAFAGLAVCAGQQFNETEQEFEQEFKQLFPLAADEQIAAQALAQSEKEINIENAKFAAGTAPFSEKLSAFSDMTKAQIEAQKEGAVQKETGRGLGAILRDQSEWYTHPVLEELYQRQTTPPASYNNSALITSVKNQMSCGSCAAFAATGAHETCMLKGGARFLGLDLSEQYLIDCGYNPSNYMSGCNGADAGSYGEFFSSVLTGQSAHEVDYPYLNINPKLTCPKNQTIYNSGAYVATPMPDYSCTEDKLKTLVSTYGAAVSNIYASDAAFGNYAKGVFTGCTSQKINHAILVVGYGTDAATGLDYWTIKNSWGTGWGNNGYIQIQRGNNQCGIGKFCYAAQCGTTNGTISDPPTVPPPPPVPASQTCDLSKYWPKPKALNGGVYTITWGAYVSSLNCADSVCRPAVAGPSNACIYICGKETC